MPKIENFKDLNIWKVGIKIVNEIYIITKQFPVDELYGITAQTRRSAVSIPSNIAEGFKRYHVKEYKRFLRIALGSAAELETQLIIVQELKWIDNQNLVNIFDMLNHLARMITALLNKLPKR